LYKTQVLIISNRKELSIKYKKLIVALNQEVVFTDDLAQAISIIQKQNIEFIIISDTIKEKLSDFIRKLRALTYNFRPIIIAVTKSGDLEDKLNILETGADDVLGEEISKSEFQMRFKAHLRRYIESSLNPITRLLDRNLTVKALKKALLTKEEISVLLIKIKNINLYAKTHGEIATEKVLQTLSAIINSTLSEKDFIGHINDEEFILITNHLAAEKIASFLAFAFDNILNKFYCEDEFENNFTLETSDNTQETKHGLMRLAISSTNAQNCDYREVINTLEELSNLLDSRDSSTYIIDRARLGGEIEKEKQKTVLILEEDIALSLLLKNVCEINEINAQITNTKKEFEELYESLNPSVVLLDWGHENDSKNLELAKKVSNDKVKLIFSSSYLNKKQILKAGADLYIPKPYEIEDMVNWIKKFLS